MILEVKGIHSFKLLPTFRKIQRIQVMFDDPLRQVFRFGAQLAKAFFFPQDGGQRCRGIIMMNNWEIVLCFFPYPQFSYPQQESEKQVCDRSQSDAK